MRKEIRKNLSMASAPNLDIVHSHLLNVGGKVSPELYTSIRGVGPISIPSCRDQNLCYFLGRSIIGQQLSTKAARSIWNKLEQAAEQRVGIPGYFGTASQREFRKCGVSANKMKALRSLYTANKKGILDSEHLGELDHNTRSSQLKSIWGIGQWTCDMASIFYFLCPDIWPETDASVQRTFHHLAGRGAHDSTLNRFSPYRSYLALSMWQFADAVPTN